MRDRLLSTKDRAADASFCARRELIASSSGDIKSDRPAAWLSSAEYLASWVRLCPGNHESAGKCPPHR